MEPKIFVINIGNELLIGKTLNTNLVYIGNKLFQLGLEISEAITIPDEPVAIQGTLRRLWQENVLLIFTGGLGPTQDDLTKNTISEFFGKKLIFHADIFVMIKERFALLQRAMPEINRVQAFVPEGFTALSNTQGSAPGLTYLEGNKALFCLPGVPFEMEHLFQTYIEPYIHNQGVSRPFFCYDVNTYHISESKIAEILADLLPEEGVQMAWLPKIGRVDVRIYGKNLVGCSSIVKKTTQLLQGYIWGNNESSPVNLLHRIIQEKKLTISTAESCTGGMLSAMFTKNAGSSTYFKGSIITYSNEMKKSHLGVNENTLNRFGAVSVETVKEMLHGCSMQLSTDLTLAVSGIAGPGGGTAEKPVGTVIIGVRCNKIEIYEKFFFVGTRENIRLRTCDEAFFMVLKALGEIN